MRSSDLFGFYIRGLCSLVGARGISVYVSAAPGAPARGIVTPHGEPPLVPEFADLAQVERFLHDVTPELRTVTDTAGASGAVEVPSHAPDGRLIGIRLQPPA